MTDHPALRNALLTATRRDLRRRTRRQRATAAVAATLLLGGSGAYATGVLFAPPQVDHSVPAVAEWTYFAQDPYGTVDGPVLTRLRPEARDRINRDDVQRLAAQGVTAQCGVDADHPLACFDVDGALIRTITPSNETAADYDIRSLTADQAQAWLCTHPSQRPGADGGERPAPQAGPDC